MVYYTHLFSFILLYLIICILFTYVMYVIDTDGFLDAHTSPLVSLIDKAPQIHVVRSSQRYFRSKIVEDSCGCWMKNPCTRILTMIHASKEYFRCIAIVSIKH